MPRWHWYHFTRMYRLEFQFLDAVVAQSGHHNDLLSLLASRRDILDNLSSVVDVGVLVAPYRKKSQPGAEKDTRALKNKKSPISTAHVFIGYN